MIGRRLDALDDRNRDCVLTLALCESLDADLLRDLVNGLDVSRAEEQGTVRMIDTDGRAQVRLAHRLLGEVLLERIDRAVVRQSRPALADALAASNGGAGAYSSRPACAWMASTTADPTVLRPRRSASSRQSSRC